MSRITERSDLAMLAIQGPEARAKFTKLLSAPGATEALALEPFFGKEVDRLVHRPHRLHRRRRLRSDAPATDAVRVWKALNGMGIASCGLGARDTLRLEAGMNLYGNDMDESKNPLESGLAWTVAFEPASRDFIGRKALEAIRERGSPLKLVGLLLEDRGVLRSHQKVIVDGAGEGETTSGTFSPTLERAIAFARVPATVAGHVQVDIRGKLLNARVVKPPFVRFGKPCITHTGEHRS